MEINLVRGQIIYIDSIRYVVLGMIKFCENEFTWYEYKIKEDNPNGAIKWLNVEINNNIVQYSLYHIENSFFCNSRTESIIFNSQIYELCDKGKATVEDYYGSVDVYFSAECDYYEYQCLSDSRKRLSVEEWEGEIEKSYGIILDNIVVQITDEIRDTYDSIATKTLSNNQKITLSGLFFPVVAIVIIIVIILLALFNINNSAIKKYLEKSSLYEYVTSITSSENNKIAKVYTTKYQVKETVEDIIKNSSAKINDVIEDTDEKTKMVIGIGMKTNSEYVYVYESVDNKTYVKVSDKKYVTSRSNLYRAKYNNHYYGTYFKNGVSSNYSSLLNSIKQSSVSSRTFRGGGLSFGK